MVCFQDTTTSLWPVEAVNIARRRNTPPVRYAKNDRSAWLRSKLLLAV